MIRNKLSDFCWKWMVPCFLGANIIHDTYDLITKGFQGHRLTSIAISGSILRLYIHARRGGFHYSWLIPVGTLVGLGATVLLTIGVLTRPWYDPINLLAVSLLLGCIIALTPLTPAEEAEDKVSARAQALSEFTDLVNSEGPESEEVKMYMNIYADDPEIQKLFQTVLQLVGPRKNSDRG